MNFNRTYMDNNKNTVQLDNVRTEQDMDESDSPLRQQARVFCCGESPRGATKLLLTRFGPGQAVQVIPVQSKGNMTSDAYEVKLTFPQFNSYCSHSNSVPLQASQAKKQKISQVQQL